MNLDTGKKQVRTVSASPVTSALLTRHFYSVSHPIWGLGYLPGDWTGTTVGLIDLDVQNFSGNGIVNARDAVLSTCREQKIPAYLERSSSGLGWHVWLFSDEALPYANMRLALRSILIQAEIAAETYPAGDSVSSRWFIMPYRGALSDSRRLSCTWLQQSGGDPIPVDQLSKCLQRTPVGRLLALANMNPLHCTPSVSATRISSESTAGASAALGQNPFRRRRTWRWLQPNPTVPGDWSDCPTRSRWSSTPPGG